MPSTLQPLLLFASLATAAAFPDGLWTGASYDGIEAAEEAVALHQVEVLKQFANSVEEVKERVKYVQKTAPGWALGIVSAVAGFLDETVQVPAVKAHAAAMSLAQAVSLSDLRPGGRPVRWEHLTVVSGDGTRLRATVAIPQQRVGERASFPVVVMPNSWALCVLEYTLEQQEWAAAGYVVLHYQARGWLNSEGLVEVAGPADVADAKAVLDEVGKRAAEWRADAEAIGMVGVSYGGGLALLGAAHDARVKCAASLSGWGNLTRALAGQAAPTQPHRSDSGDRHTCERLSSSRRRQTRSGSTS